MAKLKSREDRKFLGNYVCRAINRIYLPLVHVDISHLTMFFVCGVYYGLNVCVPSQFLCWNPTSQYDGVGRYGLWEVVRLRWSPKSRVFMNGSGILINPFREGLELASPLWALLCGDTVRTGPSATGRELDSINPDILILDLQLTAL